VLLLLIALQKGVDCINVVNWIQKFSFHCAVLLIVIAVKQSGYL